MGGHALKTVESIRLPKDDYQLVEEFVLKNLSEYHVFVTRYSNSKESFGDMDVVFSNTTEDPKEIINRLFYPI